MTAPSLQATACPSFFPPERPRRTSLSRAVSERQNSQARLYPQIVVMLVLLGASPPSSLSIDAIALWWLPLTLLFLIEAKGLISVMPRSSRVCFPFEIALLVSSAAWWD